MPWRRVDPGASNLAARYDEGSEKPSLSWAGGGDEKEVRAGRRATGQ